MVAVLPENPTEATEFLKAHEVNVDQIAEAKLADLGVEGTPTVMLVDSHGRVLREWIGLLDSAGEKQVLSEIN